MDTLVTGVYQWFTLSSTSVNTDKNKITQLQLVQTTLAVQSKKDSDVRIQAKTKQLFSHSFYFEATPLDDITFSITTSLYTIKNVLIFGN